MGVIFNRKTQILQQPQAPLYERMQDWIFKMDLGSGTRLFRLGMFVLSVVLVMLLYTATQFYGLRDAQAMDAGQLGRNLWHGYGYVTRVVRPLELAHLNSIERMPLTAPHLTQPELLMPPVYPRVLSAVFHVFHPNFQVVQGVRTVPADRVLMVCSWLFYLVGMVLMYLLAKELFDRRVAVTSAFLYLFCQPLLDFAVSGLSMCFMVVLFLVAAYGVVKAENWQTAGRPRHWVYGAFLASALAVALGILTEYAFASVLLPLLVYVAVSFPTERLRLIGLCLAVVVLLLAPWMLRNWKLSRTAFGLVRYEMYEDTGAGTANAIKPGQLQRTFSADRSKLKLSSLLRSAVFNLRNLYGVALKDVGANYLIAFFLAGLLHRYRNETAFRLRRLVFWAMILTVLWLSFAGPPRRNFLTLFMPLVIVYASAFFYVMFERLQFRTRLLRRGMIGLFMVLNMVPFIYTVLPPRTSDPYPPYDSHIAARLGKVFNEPDLLASDIPWAVAWYADRSTVWAPLSKEDYDAVNDKIHFVRGIYLTQATFQQLTSIEALSGQQSFWIRMFQSAQSGIPLTVTEGLVSNGEQILVSDRPRWGHPDQ